MCLEVIWGNLLVGIFENRNKIYTFEYSINPLIIMFMKKLFLFFAGIAVSFTSCVDSDYDLSNVNTDNITLGAEELRCPLATVRVALDDLRQNGTDIREVCAEADDWLATNTGREFLDLKRLMNDEAYFNELAGELLEEMAADPTKRKAVAGRVYDRYRDEFLPMMGVPQSIGRSRFVEVYVTRFGDDDRLREKTVEVARRFLEGIEIEPMEFQLDRINISSDMFDMLTQNLDPRDDTDPESTLSLEGTITSVVPLSYRLTPEFIPAGIRFMMPVDAEIEGPQTLPSTQIFAENLDAVIRGVRIVIPVSLERYYFKRPFVGGDQLVIKLSLMKRGGLQIDF